MSNPIFYDKAKSKESELPATTPEPVAAPIEKVAPIVDSPAPKKPQKLTPSSVFMEPNVYSVPKTEDLKEASSQPASKSRTSGLTVPSP